MKLITLNTWGGKVREPLIRFIHERATATDVFTFQEVYEDFFHALALMMPEHNGYFCSVRKDEETNTDHGLAIFVRKSFSVIESGSIPIHEDVDPNSKDYVWNRTRKMQWVKIENQGHKTLVMNVHGYWVHNSKFDSPERLAQSKAIIDFIVAHSASVDSKMLCGDFNLRPDTVSVQMIEVAGMRNMITEHEVKTTRTSLYTKNDERYADFIFLSKDLHVSNFSVLPEEVSDHAALMIECK